MSRDAAALTPTPAATPSLRSPILWSPRSEVRDAVRAVLKDLGAEDVVLPKTKEACVEDLIGRPDSILILDWQAGAEDSNQVLAAIKRHFHVETRPIVMLIPELDDKVVATGAEYGVSQIHAGPVSKDSLKECLAALLREDASTKDVRASLVNVATARDKGDWAVATPMLMELHDKYPDNERVATELAENLIYEGAWDHAATVLEPFTKGEPPYIRALHLLGRCALAKGDADKAIGLLERAKIINPHNAMRLVDLGTALLQVDRVADARENFEAAAELDPDSKDARAGQGQCMLLQGEVNEALTLLKESSGPRELASIFNTAAVLAMRQGRFDQGMALYKAALQAVSRDEKVASRLYFNMGIGYKRWNKPDRAVACFEKSLELDPTYVKAARHKDHAQRSPRRETPPPAAPAKAPQADGSAFAEEDFTAVGRTPGAAAKKPLPLDEPLSDAASTDDFDVDE
jgi:Flp pilus assembly protein TadD